MIVPCLMNKSNKPRHYTWLQSLHPPRSPLHVPPLPPPPLVLSIAYISIVLKVAPSLPPNVCFPTPVPIPHVICPTMVSIRVTKNLDIHKKIITISTKSTTTNVNIHHGY